MISCAFWSSGGVFAGILISMVYRCVIYFDALVWGEGSVSHQMKTDVKRCRAFCGVLLAGIATSWCSGTSMTPSWCLITSLTCASTCSWPLFRCTALNRVAVSQLFFKGAVPAPGVCESRHILHIGTPVPKMPQSASFSLVTICFAANKTIFEGSMQQFRTTHPLRNG